MASTGDLCTVLNQSMNNLSAELQTKASYASFQSRIPTVFYLITIVVIGTVGNILVLLVYGRRFKPSATRVFVMALALCNLLTCCLGIPLELDSISRAYSLTEDVEWICQGYFAFVSLSTAASAFILTLVAIDRCHRVCRPLKPQLSESQARLIVLVTTGLSSCVFLLFSPVFGSATINLQSQTASFDTNVTLKTCWVRSLRANDGHYRAFRYASLLVAVVVSSILGSAYSLIGLEMLFQKWEASDRKQTWSCWSTRRRQRAKVSKRRSRLKAAAEISRGTGEEAKGQENDSTAEIAKKIADCELGPSQCGHLFQRRASRRGENSEANLPVSVRYLRHAIAPCHVIRKSSKVRGSLIKHSELLPSRSTGDIFLQSQASIFQHQEASSAIGSTPEHVLSMDEVLPLVSHTRQSLVSRLSKSLDENAFRVQDDLLLFTEGLQQLQQLTLNLEDFGSAEESSDFGAERTSEKVTLVEFPLILVHTEMEPDKQPAAQPDNTEGADQANETLEKQKCTPLSFFSGLSESRFNQTNANDSGNDQREQGPLQNRGQECISTSTSSPPSEKKLQFTSQDAQHSPDDTMTEQPQLDENILGEAEVENALVQAEFSPVTEQEDNTTSTLSGPAIVDTAEKPSSSRTTTVRFLKLDSDFARDEIVCHLPTSGCQSETSDSEPEPVRREASGGQQATEIGVRMRKSGGLRPPSCRSSRGGEGDGAPRISEAVVCESSAAGLKLYRRHKRTKTTWTMFVLSALYLLNWLPHLIARGSNNKGSPINWCDKLTECGWNSNAIALRSLYVNCAIGVFVYGLCNPRFRQESRRLWQDLGRLLGRCQECLLVPVSLCLSDREDDRETGKGDDA